MKFFCKTACLFLMLTESGGSWPDVTNFFSGLWCVTFSTMKRRWKRTKRSWLASPLTRKSNLYVQLSTFLFTIEHYKILHNNVDEEPQNHSQLERHWALISLHLKLQEKEKINNDNNSQSASAPQGPLVRWLKVNFSEAFIAWIHIKALRVFTESVLRYSVAYKTVSYWGVCCQVYDLFVCI